MQFHTYPSAFFLAVVWDFKSDLGIYSGIKTKKWGNLREKKMLKDRPSTCLLAVQLLVSQTDIVQEILLFLKF